MTLLGASTAARIRTSARVDKAFALRSFSFSLDPGTGAVEVRGTLAHEGRRLELTTKTAGGTRTETRDLEEAPALSLNLSRRLAAEGLRTGAHLTVPVFDPATLRNATMNVDVEGREVVKAAGRPVPAFRVRTEFAGITSTSWVTDVGEVVREESGMGLIVVKETRDRALALAVPGEMQRDMLQAAAVEPAGPGRIDDPRLVDVLRLRVEGLGTRSPDLEGAGQTVAGDVFEIRDLTAAAAGPADPEAAQSLKPEPFIESDDPEVRKEAEKGTADAVGPRAQAEKLVRHVNFILEKKPTMSLPSAREVLRTRVGDCNEHTVLYVAMARSLGIPSRIAVGLVYLHGAFYYHAWPEVYLEGPPGRLVASRGPHAERVSRRRHPRAPGPWRPGPASRDHSPHRPHQDVDPGGAGPAGHHPRPPRPRGPGHAPHRDRVPAARGRRPHVLVEAGTLGRAA